MQVEGLPFPGRNRELRIRGSTGVMLQLLVWIIGGCVNSALAMAQEGEDAPNPGQWVADVLKKSHPAVPRSVAFLRSFQLDGKNPPHFLVNNTKELNRLGYFQVPDARSVRWDYLLNAAALTQRPPLAALVSLTGSDLLVLAGNKKPRWEIYKVYKGRPKPLHEAPAPLKINPKSLITWWREELGWDGVVLDQRGRYVLIGSYLDLLIKPKIQALAVAASHKDIILKGERQGAGLLSLHSFDGAVGVFEVVLLGNGLKRLPVGTKVMIEQSK